LRFSTSKTSSACQIRRTAIKNAQSTRVTSAASSTRSSPTPCRFASLILPRGLHPSGLGSAAAREARRFPSTRQEPKESLKLSRPPVPSPIAECQSVIQLVVELCVLQPVDFHLRHACMTFPAIGDKRPHVMQRHFAAGLPLSSIS
jgi:hypothetical protein